MPHLILNIFIGVDDEEVPPHSAATLYDAPDDDCDAAKNRREFAIDEIIQEISIVILNAQRGASTNCKFSNELSVQSVFGILDTFQAWNIAGKQHLAQLMKSAAKANTASNAQPNTQLPASVVKLNELLASVDRLLAAIPNQNLGEAAISIKAYARAIRYVETDAREIYRSVCRSMLPMDVAQSEGVTTKSRIQPKKFRDRANGALPVMSSHNLDVIMAAFAKLEDEDSLHGIQALRKIYGYQSTPWSRLLYLEHTNDWVGFI